MISLLFLVAASAQLDALNQAVARCDRGTANPVFAAETATRSSFLLDAYREQEAIVAARLDLAQRRATLREAGATKSSDENAGLAVPRSHRATAWLSASSSADAVMRNNSGIIRPNPPD